ncbi:MAG: helix-turn-helix transcriptional regulator [Rhizobiaceae bacterium]
MRTLFAKNLKRLCATQKSYAHVARELGVNRQQFDSYIKGRNLPNEGVVDRICAYFQVDIGTLFRDHDPVSEFSAIDGLIDTHKKYLNDLIGQEVVLRRGGIADGKYFVYFSMPSDPDHFICSLMAVRREGGFTTFRRITRKVSASDTLRSVKFGLHSGVILFRENVLFLLGHPSADEAAPSMLAANELLSRDVPFGGRAIVHAGSTFHIVKFWITPIPPRMKIWKAMQRVRVLGKSEIASLSPRLAVLMEQ